ncbi:hypothetical protein NL317_32290, partial [Klebsiella pneumoniae]|nr:hypothetical protein [Klebsiella pneumoniae]
MAQLLRCTSIGALGIALAAAIPAHARSGVPLAVETSEVTAVVQDEQGEESVQDEQEGEIVVSGFRAS